MKVSDPKTIDTLVSDIYTLVNTGKKNPDKEALFALGSAVMEAVRRQLWVLSNTPRRQ